MITMHHHELVAQQALVFIIAHIIFIKILVSKNQQLTVSFESMRSESFQGYWLGMRIREKVQ